MTPLSVLSEYVTHPKLSMFLRNFYTKRTDKIPKMYEHLYKEKAIILQKMILEAPRYNEPITVYIIVTKYFDCEVGSIFRDAGFMSTSYDYHLSVEFGDEDPNMLVISLPPEYPFLVWNREVILPAGTSFKIIQKSYDTYNFNYKGHEKILSYHMVPHSKIFNKIPITSSEGFVSGCIEI